MESSVFTVIVRNQRHQDVSIEISPKCTIKELKSKIESEHPCCAKASQLKLVHNGKLLIDHHVINTVIKESHRIIHLVYSSESNEDPIPTTSNTPTSEIRRRVTHDAPSMASPETNSPRDYSAYSQAYANWFQQYQQQYSTYMQYYAGQSPYFPMAPTVQPLPTENDATGAHNNENNDPVGGQDQDQQNPNGAFVVADENGQDWLDALFALTRFFLLLSIIYFYSSTYRFIIAVSLLLVVYLYQAGVFQVERRPAPPQEPNAAENEQPAPADDNNNNDNESNGDGAEEHPPPPPGIFATAICFVRSFFSSLVPTGPPGVAN